MKRNQYDETFKSEAVKLALSGELSYAEIARDLGVNYGTLTNWIYATMSNPKSDKISNTTQPNKPSKQDYQTLERQLKAAHKELDLRKREIDFLKKSKRVLCEPEIVKYAMIAQETGLSTLRKCTIMGVSRSGFYDWRKREVSNREISNVQLDKHIRDIYNEHAGRYGYRRICEELREIGLSASLERVRRRMKRIGLRGIQSRKFKYTTNSKHNLPIEPNLLEQDFNVTAPNTAWVGDITYIRVKQQWLYLAVILDLYSRKVIGWAFGVRINAKLVCDALKSALRSRDYPTDVIMHTDRGSQYCSHAYQKLIKAYQLKCSMSGTGNCYDNAACESFFHTLKVEYVYQYSFGSIEHAQSMIFWFIEVYYNQKRKHSTIGYKSPVNFELAYIKLAA